MFLVFKLVCFIKRMVFYYMFPVFYFTTFYFIFITVGREGRYEKEGTQFICYSLCLAGRSLDCRVFWL